MKRRDEMHEEFKNLDGQTESIKNDVVFEMELVKQIEVNIDYILMLISNYHKSNCKDKEILISIDKAIKSSLSLRSKRELIEMFIARINVETDVENDWVKFVKEQEKIDLDKLIKDENLNKEETEKFIKNSFRDGYIKILGTEIEKVLPPMRLFGGGDKIKRKQGIVDKMLIFFNKYFGLGIFGNS